jgi:ABC-type lipoprotein release transport system permease subunit
MQTERGVCSVDVRGIEGLQEFFRRHPASVNGSLCQNGSEANAGVILAKIAAIQKGDTVNLTVNGNSLSLSIAGVVQANQQTDAELLLPLATLDALSPCGGSVSMVEFSLADSTQSKDAVANLTQTLPSNLKIECTQQATAFAADINNQMVVFINVWSIAVYAVVAAASYVIASRVVSEAKYEFYVLGTLGAKRRLTSQLILGYALAVALVGCIVGLSVGVVGAQAASTFARWLLGNTALAPFLEGIQALEILLFATFASFIGCLYPAVRGRFTHAEASAT